MEEVGRGLVEGGEGTRRWEEEGRGVARGGEGAVYGGVWRCMEVYGGVWRCMEV